MRPAVGKPLGHLLVLLFVALAVCAPASGRTEAQSDDTLVVAAYEVKPFVVRTSGTVLYDEFIGFGVRGGSELRDPIDATLADLHQEGIVIEIVDRWTN